MNVFKRNVPTRNSKFQKTIDYACCLISNKNKAKNILEFDKHIEISSERLGHEQKTISICVCAHGSC